MTKYICDRCNKIFDQKSHYNDHLNRKKPCIAITPGAEPKLTNIIQKNGNNIISDVLKCSFCNKVFTRKDNLTRHMNDRCQIKKLTEASMEKVAEKVLEKLKEENKSIINNTTNITIDKLQINYAKPSIVPYGEEDTSNISDSTYIKLFVKQINSVPELVKYLHFDENHPENHNVYISNIKDGYVLVYDGKQWEIKYRDVFLDDMFERGWTFLEEKFNELIDKLSEVEIRKFKAFLDKAEEDKTIKHVKNELRLILYNKRNMVIETRKNSHKKLKLITD